MRLPGRTHETCGGDPLRVGSPFLRSSLQLSRVVVDARRFFRAPHKLDHVLFAIGPFLAALLLLSLPAVCDFGIIAQSDVANASIEGFVADQQGAGVSQATVSLTSPERGLVRTTKTNDEGLFRLLLLPPGVYELRVDAIGFQSQILR